MNLYSYLWATSCHNIQFLTHCESNFNPSNCSIPIHLPALKNLRNFCNLNFVTLSI